MKIYMLCDMEGVSGLYTREHTWYWEAGAREAVANEGCRLMTEDVNSATAATLEAGVDELVVCDTHHGGGNVLWSELLSDPRVLYETPQAPRLMPSLDRAFDGLILLGHHAKAGTQGAFLNHTWSGAWFDFQINGQSVGEIGIETCYAGHWDVPLVMVQGDEACCAEAEDQFSGVVTAAVKRAVSYNRASGPAPELGRKRTAEKVAEAVAKARGKELEPFKPQLPHDGPNHHDHHRAHRPHRTQARRPASRRTDRGDRGRAAVRYPPMDRWISPFPMHAVREQATSQGVGFSVKGRAAPVRRRH